MPDTSKRSTTTDPLRAPDPLRARGGFADLVGYELMTWEEDLAEIALTVADRHLNRSGLMHGGVLTTLADTAFGYCVCFTAATEPPRPADTPPPPTSFIHTRQPRLPLAPQTPRPGRLQSVV